MNPWVAILEAELRAVQDCCRTIDALELWNSQEAREYQASAVSALTELSAAISAELNQPHAPASAPGVQVYDYSGDDEGAP